MGLFRDVDLTTDIIMPHRDTCALRDKSRASKLPGAVELAFLYSCCRILLRPTRTELNPSRTRVGVVARR